MMQQCTPQASRPEAGMHIREVAAHIRAQDSCNGWLERDCGPKSVVHNAQSIILSLQELL